MLVTFQSLIDEAEPPQFGVVTDDNVVYCLCGCDGCFEPDDYHIIDRYPKCDAGSVLAAHFANNKRAWRNGRRNGLKIRRHCP